MKPTYEQLHAFYIAVAKLTVGHDICSGDDGEEYSVGRTYQNFVDYLEARTIK